jgi:uncharacterized protein
MGNELIRVEVVFGTARNQSLIELQVPRGTTLVEAIRLSGVVDQFPEIDIVNSRKGIFGRIAGNDRVLEDHDRVEIYRPLLVDPMEARRRRAGKKI